MRELIYYVDSQDKQTGETCEKYSAHNASTKLHAAFSVYVFNTKGDFLVTKRASTKKVWPNVWTNSCCGHPMPNESRQDAIKRRMAFELGMTVDKIKCILPKYIYKTPPYNGIIEHEFCPVFIAISSDQPILNPEEVDDYKWVSWQWFLKQTAKDGNDYSNPDSPGSPIWSWWCKDQLKHISNNQDISMLISS